MSKLRVADPASYARLGYIDQLQSYRPSTRVVKIEG
jgi:hypothetical protein